MTLEHTEPDINVWLRTIIIEAHVAMNRADFKESIWNIKVIGWLLWRRIQNFEKEQKGL